MADIEDALEKAARVAKIELSSSEKKLMEKEMELFLNWLKPLTDTEKLSDILNMSENEQFNALRHDEALNAELKATRKAAPRFTDGYYMVPPIIE